jgi:hypothetical protein
MTRSTTVSRPASLRRFTATVQHGGHDFPFELCTRELRLSPEQSINYAWMDSTAFRITKNQRGRDHTNVRSILSHWWATRQSCGWHRDPHEIYDLLLAANYAALSGGKTTHQVFRDAHLRAGRTALVNVSLPGEVNLRIRDVVRSRDCDRVGAEFDLILGVPEKISTICSKVMQQTFEGILALGFDLFRERDAAGVWEFMGKVDAWVAAKRKKGNQGWLRTFLNRFAYECKVAFYTSYTNAWIDIIPVLRQDHGLDPVGERFVRFWHSQYQPIELANGTVIPDVFRGQVLALHPLSGYFMQDPALLTVAGRFFGTDAHDRVFVDGDSNVPEYWELVGAILTAGHQYRQAFERQEARRGARFSKSDEGATTALSSEESATLGMLDDYAMGRGFRCSNSKCQGGLRLESVAGVAEDAETCSASFVCVECRHPVSKTISYADLAAWCSGNG